MNLKMLGETFHIRIHTVIPFKCSSILGKLVDDFKKKNSNCFWGLGLPRKRQEGTFGVMKIYLYKDSVIEVYAFFKTHEMKHLRFKHFSVCKFYLKS